jgi:hypothetical protein
MSNNMYTRNLKGLTMGTQFAFFLVRELHVAVIIDFNNSCSIEGIVRANVILCLCNFRDRFPYYVVRKCLQDIRSF